MPADNPRPAGKPGWRGGSAQGGPRAAAGPKAGWAQRKDHGPQRARWGHRLKIAGWGFLFVVLFAGLLSYLLYRPVTTPLVAVVATSYEAPLPPNAWAREDVDRLLAPRAMSLFSDDSGEVAWESKEHGLRQLRRKLESIRPGGPRRDVVMVYLSMHGLLAMVQGSEEPILLPPGASRSNPDQWLTVRELLRYLFVDDHEGKIPDRVTKLLVLDSTRIDANWGFGILYNGFADRLGDVVEEAHVPNLIVLNASGPGQIGWDAPELQGSVFGYFFERGLAGAADSPPQGNGDGQVSVQELYQYLALEVGQWVTENRADVQQPMLLPHDAEHALVHARWTPETSADVATAGAGATATATADDPRWQTLARLWLGHQDLMAKRPYRVHPLEWEEFQQTLLRLEQAASSGMAYDEEFRQGVRRVESLMGVLTEDPLPQQLAAYSLPMAGCTGRLANLGKPRNDLPGPWKTSSVKGPAGKEPEKEVRYGQLEAVAAGWDWFAADPTADKLTSFLRCVDRGRRQPRVDAVELQWLRMLDAYVDWKSAAGHLKPALAAMVLAEEAAAPADERVQYAAWALVDQADVHRRLAEDRLLIGTPEALATADNLFAVVAGKDGRGGVYREAIELQKRLAAAMALRDRAYAETPYIAQWLLARLHDGGDRHLDDLEQLLSDSSDLGRELQRSLQGGNTTPALTGAMQRVEEKLRSLQDAIAQQCDLLKRTPSGDKRTLRDIAAVLAIPLVTGQVRNDLRRKSFEIAGRSEPDASVVQSESSRKVAKTPTGASIEPAAAWLDRLARWEVHPAFAMLGHAVAEVRADGRGETVGPAKRIPAGAPAANGENRSREAARQSLIAQGEKIRRWTVALPDLSSEPMAETAKLLAVSGQSNTPPIAVRAGRARAESLARASASFAGRAYWSVPAADPVDQLRRLDWHDLMLWQCRRCLNDFWGPAPGRETPFFQIAAQDYLDAAGGLGAGDASLWFAGVRLPELLALRREAARNGMAPKAGDLTIDEDELVSVHSMSVTLLASLPPGEAAVYLLDAAHRPIRMLDADMRVANRMGVSIDGRAKTEHRAYAIPNDAHLAGLSRLDATALFRGNLFARGFNVERSTAAVDIACERGATVSPRVTVSGQAGQRDSIVVVFDCSGSMSERVKTEQGQAPRIEAARNGLLQILQRLVDPEQPYRLGMFLYAHRARWSGLNGEPLGRVVMRPRGGPETHPADDVERVLDAGEFTNRELTLLREKLGAVEPWGQTPLFNAILHAIDEALLRGGSGRKRIVVITDGLDDPGDMELRVNVAHPKTPRVFQADVQRKLAGHNDIRLDILGFDVVPNNAEERASLEGLKQLAQSTGGKFYFVANPSGLIEALEKSLQLDKYVVLSAKDLQPLTPAPVPLNATSVLPPVAGPTPLVVRLVDPARPAQAEIEISGGESLQLYVQDDAGRGGRRLVHRRYTSPEMRREVDRVADPQNPQRRFFIAAYQPEWQGSSLRFSLSLQNADEERFSGRPGEAWVEIRPEQPGAAQGKQAYWFYDLEYQPGRPAPVLDFIAPRWPPEAGKASMRLWFKTTPTAPDKAIPMSSFTQQKLQIESIPNVTFEMETKRGAGAADPYRVLVTERYGPQATWPSAKVGMDPAPKKVVHRYNAETRTIRHTFFFSDAEVARMGDYRLRITSLKRLTEGAVSLPQPLELTIPRTAIPAKP